MRPFSVEHIDHVVLRVRDLARSEDFYCQVLGCQVVRRREHLGLVHLRTGTSMIDLVALEGTLGRRGGAGAGVEGRNVDHLCLRVEPFDVDAIVGFLGRQGVVVQGPAKVNFGAEGDGLSLYLRDPDGNAIELKGPAQAG